MILILDYDDEYEKGKVPGKGGKDRIKYLARLKYDSDTKEEVKYRGHKARFPELLLEQLGPEPVEILALDLARHGTSDHRTSEDYALCRYIEDADQIVEQLGWQRHAIIAHSLGGATHGAISALYTEEQPQHQLEHITDKKKLLAKRAAFHPTVESVCESRSHRGAYGIAPELAEFLMPRGLRPAERTLEDGKTVVQGWTWLADRLLTIRSAQSMSEDYAKAFMTRITCPVFAVMAEDGLFHFMDGKKSKIPRKKERDGWPDWIHKNKLTLTSVPGKHPVPIEKTPLVASKIVPWILVQDVGEVAKL
ncbi:hypothetical protein BGW39_006772 [Mortierella sp. 14UC]|nr:hypothetical protein BGW39_006772 [Mortierella sp. 14UC]